MAAWPGCFLSARGRIRASMPGRVPLSLWCRPTRRQGGKCLSEHQVIQLKLNEMHMLTEALRSFVMRTAWERDRATLGDKTARDFVNANLAMIFSKDVIQ